MDFELSFVIHYLPPCVFFVIKKFLEALLMDRKNIPIICHSRPVSEYGVNSGGNPDSVPAKAGNHSKRTGFRIPPKERRASKCGMTDQYFAILL
jgi:hypothetical protein